MKKLLIFTIVMAMTLSFAVPVAASIESVNNDALISTLNAELESRGVETTILHIDELPGRVNAFIVFIQIFNIILLLGISFFVIKFLIVATKYLQSLLDRKKQ